MYAKLDPDATGLVAEEAWLGYMKEEHAARALKKRHKADQWPNPNPHPYPNPNPHPYPHPNSTLTPTLAQGGPVAPSATVHPETWLRRRLPDDGAGF